MIVGPLVAILSFVCSVGNIPLAAVLWSGGIGFGGVIAFVFADLLVLPIVMVYRKYYGSRYAVRIVGLMFVTIVIAALIVDGAVRRRRADPAGTPHASGRVRRSEGRLHARTERARHARRFAALLGLTRAARRDRSGVRDERSIARKR